MCYLIFCGHTKCETCKNFTSKVGGVFEIGPTADNPERILWFNNIVESLNLNSQSGIGSYYVAPLTAKFCAWAVKLKAHNSVWAVSAQFRGKQNHDIGPRLISK